MAAALSRAEQLADENEGLREEIARLRVANPEAPQKAPAPDLEVADEALRVLAHLAEESERRPFATPAEELPKRRHATEAVLLDDAAPKATQVRRASAPAAAVIAGWRARSVLLVSIVTFFMGMAVATCMNH